ncbi:hypothetical protein EDD22DRAFT_853438, partial [Suillus occidentalis]
CSPSNEVGGVERVIEAVKSGQIKKPTVAWAIGTCASMFATEVQFGHAGSMANSDSCWRLAKVMIAGGFDDIGEEGSYEFANMKATSNAETEFAMGSEPIEMSRPAITTHSGTVLEIGAPIRGILAFTSTSTDKAGRSIPAPDRGALSVARELSSKYPLPSIRWCSGSTCGRRRIDIRTHPHRNSTSLFSSFVKGLTFSNLSSAAFFTFLYRSPFTLVLFRSNETSTWGGDTVGAKPKPPAAAALKTACAHLKVALGTQYLTPLLRGGLLA